MPALKYRKHIRSLRDDEFDSIYPPEVRALSRVHWTPAAIARRAAKFLVTKPGTKVLDIGCGPGKFCIVGALSTPGQFTGVEQRENLVQVARTVLFKAKIWNARIMQANITEVDFSRYDAFYLFNPFMENLLDHERIDDAFELSDALYRRYTDYVARQLAVAPLGTRIATYCNSEVPVGYSSIETLQPDHFDLPDTLRFWKKCRSVTAAELRNGPSAMVHYELSALDLTPALFFV